MEWSTLFSAAALAGTVISTAVSMLNRNFLMNAKLNLSEFENRFLDRMNGRYMRRTEVDLLIQERDMYRNLTERRLDHLEGRK